MGEEWNGKIKGTASLKIDYIKVSYIRFADGANMCNAIN